LASYAFLSVGGGSSGGNAKSTNGGIPFTIYQVKRAIAKAKQTDRRDDNFKNVSCFHRILAK